MTEAVVSPLQDGRRSAVTDTVWGLGCKVLGFGFCEIGTICGPQATSLRRAEPPTEPCSKP